MPQPPRYDSLWSRTLASSILSLCVACSGDDSTLSMQDAGGAESEADAALGPTPGADAGTPGEGTPDAGTPPSPDLRTIDVGRFDTGSDGTTPPFEFDLPDTVSSFMLIAKATPGTNVIVATMDGPTGQLVTDEPPADLSPIERLILGQYVAQFKSPNRVVQDIEVSAALFPNNPNVTIKGGRYTAQVAASVITGNQGAPYVGPVDVQVVYREGESARGRLDVTLYFTGAGMLSAESGPTSALIQGALSRLKEIYAEAGVEIGAIAYKDVDERFRTITVSGTSGPLEEMFASTEGPGLHFFFVDRFESPIGGGAIGGISGGLPGPPLRPGSVNSGVAVSVAAAGDDPGVLAHVMAHEGGHWLGLFHTSEITGTEDQHPQTPAGQEGNLHLMYPAVGGGTMITPSQAAVLRAHAETVTIQ